MKKKFRITLNDKTYDVVAETIGEDDGAPIIEPAGARRARSGGASAVAAPAPTRAPAAGQAGDIPSPLAGKVVSLDVSVGQSIQAGQKIITLEAMKMSTVVNAPLAGTVKAFHVKPGDAVEEGQPLLSVE